MRPQQFIWNESARGQGPAPGPSAQTPWLCPLLWGTKSLLGVPMGLAFQAPPHPRGNRRPLPHPSQHLHAVPWGARVKGRGPVTEAGGHSDPRNTHHCLTAAHLQEQDRGEASLWLSLPPTCPGPTHLDGWWRDTPPYPHHSCLLRSLYLGGGPHLCPWHWLVPLCRLRPCVPGLLFLGLFDGCPALPFACPVLSAARAP